MRSLTKRIAVAALIFQLNTLSAHAAEPKFRIHAHPETQSITYKSPALIYIDQTNIGNTAVNLPQKNGAFKHAELDYAIRIYDEDGGEPHLTPFGKNVFHPDTAQFGGIQVNPIKPGESSTELFDVSALFILEANKTYRASFEFTRRIQYLTTPLRSNWVTISVR